MAPIMGGCEIGGLGDLHPVDVAFSAEHLERVGNNLDAAMLFEQAAGGSETENQWLWLNQAAINYRLAGSAYWQQSLELFDEVIANTTDSELHARACRDKAMLLTELGRTYEARKLLADAMFRQNWSGSATEYAATSGYVGRTHLADGKVADASYWLADADAQLRGKNDLYELNNLIWLMKVAGVRRVLMLPRAVKLAFRTGYRRRGLEAGLITIRPALYDTVLDRVRQG